MVAPLVQAPYLRQS